MIGILCKNIAGSYWIESSNLRYKVPHAVARTLDTQDTRAYEHVGKSMEFSIADDLLYPPEFDGIIEACTVVSN